MPSAKRSSDEFLEHFKRERCASCELSLFCASGRSGGRSYWCRHCGGYYVPELDLLVQCSGFPAARPRYQMRPLKSNSFVRAIRTDHGESSCRRCSRGVCNQLFSEVRVVTGFLITDHA